MARTVVYQPRHKRYDSDAVNYSVRVDYTMGIVKSRPVLIAPRSIHFGLII